MERLILILQQRCLSLPVINAVGVAKLPACNPASLERCLEVTVDRAILPDLQSCCLAGDWLDRNSSSKPPPSHCWQLCTLRKHATGTSSQPAGMPAASQG